jgi:hypothetical protein
MRADYCQPIYRNGLNGNRIRRYILFHDRRHPQEMGSTKIEVFFTYPAVKEHVAASTQNPCTERSQNEALNAIVFLQCNAQSE